MSEAIFEFADSQNNPCLSCGICCTHFRVSFYWGEADDAPGGWVPVDLTEPLDPWRRCMKGTNGRNRRCVALAGRVGEEVHCTIYAQRPSPCREFPVYLANAIPNPKCQELRTRAGLPPLPVPVSGANDVRAVAPLPLPGHPLPRKGP